MVEQLLRGPYLFNLALIHHDHHISQFQGFLLVMRYEHSSDPDVSMKPSEPPPKVLAHLGIQRAKRFVKK